MNRSESIVLAIAHLPGRLWWTLPDAPNYLISTAGEVLSLCHKKHKLLRPITMGQYLGVQIKCADGRLQHRYLHRLVLESIFGSAPPGHEIAHLDGNRYNND